MYSWFIHPPITVINKNLYLRFSQLIMYVIFIIDHIHHLINKFKMLIFTFNNGWRVYIVRENWGAYFVKIYIYFFNL